MSRTLGITNEIETECYAAKEGKQPLTRSDFNGMMNTFSGKGISHAK